MLEDEHTLQEKWAQSNKTWQDCLAIYESVKYEGTITITEENIVRETDEEGGFYINSSPKTASTKSTLRKLIALEEKASYFISSSNEERIRLRVNYVKDRDKGSFALYDEYMIPRVTDFKDKFFDIIKSLDINPILKGFEGTLGAERRGVFSINLAIRDIQKIDIPTANYFDLLDVVYSINGAIAEIYDLLSLTKQASSKLQKNSSKDVTKRLLWLIDKTNKKVIFNVIPAQLVDLGIETIVVKKQRNGRNKSTK